MKNSNEEVDRTAFALSLNYLMEEAGLTYEDIKNKSKISKMTLSRIINDKSTGFDTLEVLLPIFNCKTIAEFISKGEVAAQKVQYLDKFGAILQKWREKNQYTQEKAADELGVDDPQKISDIERGRKSVPAKTMFTYLDNLGFGSMQEFAQAAGYNLPAMEMVRKTLSEKIKKQRAAGKSDSDIFGR